MVIYRIIIVLILILHIIFTFFNEFVIRLSRSLTLPNDFGI